MIETDYTIEGMNCGNCVNAVTNALTSLPDVAAASVDLASGRASISSTLPLDEGAIRSAIEDAGYTLRA